MILENSNLGVICSRDYARIIENGKGEKTGVSRLLWRNGHLSLYFDECNGRCFVTSPLDKFSVVGDRFFARTIHGRKITGTTRENTGYWTAPNGMIATGYHEGWLWQSTREEIGNICGETTVEFLKNPEDNANIHIVLSVDGYSTLITPTGYEYSIKNLPGEDGNIYPYVMLTILTRNSRYQIALKSEIPA